MVRERFAPSPTGLLHLGHAYSAYRAWHAARSAGGEFLLRIEDIDFNRSRATYTEAIKNDLAWLGIQWDRPPIMQSERMELYDDALKGLVSLGLCYPCSCTRKDIRNALSAPQQGAVSSAQNRPVT